MNPCDGVDKSVCFAEAISNITCNVGTTLTLVQPEMNYRPALTLVQPEMNYRPAKCKVVG